MNKQNIVTAIVTIVIAVVISAIVVGGNNQPSITIDDVKSVVEQAINGELGAIGSRFPNGIVAGSGSLSATGDFVADTNTLVVSAANNRIGIGSSTPGALFSLGNSGGTTTILAERLCLVAKAPTGDGYIYYTIATSSGASAGNANGFPSGGWATSTRACY